MTTVSATALPATLGPLTRTRTGGGAGALACGTVPFSLKAHRLHGTEPPHAKTATYCLPCAEYVIGVVAMPVPVCHFHSTFPLAALRASSSPSGEPSNSNPLAVVRIPSPFACGTLVVRCQTRS